MPAPADVRLNLDVKVNYILNITVTYLIGLQKNSFRHASNDGRNAGLGVSIPNRSTLKGL
jgi:hypothetical protein